MRRQEDQMSSVSSAQPAVGTDVCAARISAPERPLHDYVAKVSERTEVRRGVPLPMGTHEYGRGVNFAFFSRHASRARLELFEHPIDATAARVFDLAPCAQPNSSGDTRPCATPWFMVRRGYWCCTRIFSLEGRSFILNQEFRSGESNFSD